MNNQLPPVPEINTTKTVNPKHGSCERVLARLMESDEIIIVSHENPDADAHGSALGLLHLLRQIGIPSVVYANSSGLDKKYAALPGSSEILTELPSPRSPKALLVYVDCGEKNRVGSIFLPFVDNFSRSIDIDHHISNTYFGGLNWVDPKASSTSEMIGRLAMAAKSSGNASMATCLLAGIVGDTGSFRYSQTSADTFEMAAYLLRSGADLQLVSQRLGSLLPQSVFFFRNELLSSVQFYRNGTIAGLVIPKERMNTIAGSDEATEGLVEVIRNIEGVKVSFVARQVEELWRVSLRSHTPDNNVSEVASVFGGGGHVCAAAFKACIENFPGFLPELIEKISSISLHD
jgi:phosphoesterase RecJ-like protein